MLYTALQNELENIHTENNGSDCEDKKTNFLFRLQFFSFPYHDTCDIYQIL